MTESFVSDNYGFSIRYPRGWTARQQDRPGGPDAFQGTTVDSAPSVSRLSITRREKEVGRTLQQTAYATLPHRSDPDGCHWNGPGIAFIPIAPHGFREAVIDGRPALVRSECSHVDAVIDLGQDILVVGLRSAGRTGAGDRWTFDRFMDTLEISPSANFPDETLGLSTRFTSKLYGYSIRHPPGWDGMPAIEDGRPDVLVNSWQSGSFRSKLSIRRLALPSGESIADVSRVWLPQARLKAGECGSRLPMGGVIPRVTWFDEATIAGRPALIRSDCGVVDAIVDVNGDALLLVLQSSRSMVAGPKRLFVDLTDALEIDDGR